MSNTKKISGQTAVDLCRRFPESNTLMLARILMRDNPFLFNTLQGARSAIRFARGELKLKGGRPSPSAVPRTKSGLILPPSEAAPILPFTLDWTGSGLVMGDLHVPYHDLRNLDAAIEHAIQSGHTDYCILLGDVMDAHPLSDFVKDPKARNFQFEREATMILLDSLRGVFKKVLFKEGNHEARYGRFISKRCPELYDIPECSNLGEMLGLRERGIEYVDAARIIRLGNSKLTLLHGHEMGKGLTSPINPARGAFLRALSCTLSGHLHRTSQHNEATLDGRLITCWSIGTLADMHPAYAPVNKWDAGFAELETDGEWFEVQTKRIIEGKVV
jgi:predicted phosphodiesterase